MSEHTPDDADRFLKVLAAFSAAPTPMDAQGRFIPAPSDAALSGVFAEVTETVLRRLLHFKTGAGDALILDVSERRIRRVVSVPPGLEDRFAYLCNEMLGAHHAPAVLDILQAFVRDGDGVFVKASLPEGAVSGAFSGVSVADLEAALQRVQAGSADATSCMAAICNDAVSYVLHRPNKPPVQNGDARALDALKDLVDQQCAGDAASRVSLWQLEAPHASGILCAQFADTKLACVLPMDKALVHFSELSALTASETS